jgi:hypothetical protein
MRFGGAAPFFTLHPGDQTQTTWTVRRRRTKETSQVAKKPSLPEELLVLQTSMKTVCIDMYIQSSLTATVSMTLTPRAPGAPARVRGGIWAQYRMQMMLGLLIMLIILKYNLKYSGPEILK